MPTLRLMQRVFFHEEEVETGVLDNPDGVPQVWPASPLCPLWGQAHAVRVVVSGVSKPYTWALWLPGNGHVFAHGSIVPDARGMSCEVRPFTPCLLGCASEPYAYFDVHNGNGDLEERQHFLYAPSGPTGIWCQAAPPC